MGNTKTVGKLDGWESGEVGGSDFMSLDEGSNPVRIVSSPFQTYSHFTKDDSGQNRKVRCALKDCPVCERGEKASPRWFIAVLNRKTGKPAILEIGPQIFKGIKLLVNNKKWGDVRGYDVDFVRGPKGAQPLYVVSPEPKENLTNEEKELIKEFMGRTDLNELCVAPTPEELCEKLGIPSKKSAAKPAAGSDFDDSDFDFDK